MYSVGCALKPWTRLSMNVKIARQTGCTIGPSSCRIFSSFAMISRRAATSMVPSAIPSSRSNSGLEYFDSFHGTPVRYASARLMIPSLREQSLRLRHVALEHRQLRVLRMHRAHVMVLADLAQTLVRDLQDDVGVDGVAQRLA